jgi:hypothetical protein
MKRSHVGPLLLSLFALFGLPAVAQANQIAKSLGNLRWGMSQSELKSALKGKLKDSSKLREIDRSYAEFDGGHSRWDSTPIAEEYTHGNDEAMLSYADADGSENYYFFIGGELWKWVKVYPASAFGGRDFKGFAEKVRKRFGNGHEKQAEVNPGSGYSYKFVEYLDRNTRLRAVDKTERQGQYALVFESMDTVRSLSALRSNTIRRATNKRPAMAKAAPREQEEADEEAPRTVRSKESRSAPSQPAAFTLASAKKRSIFADEQQDGESDADYAARKQRTNEKARSMQRKNHERNEDAKKGKILDELAGVDDNDPISGMK